MTDTPFYVHPTAEVSPDAHVGAGTRIWRQAHVREHASIGESCNIGKGVYIETHVRIGSRVKIQNHVSIFEGVTLEDGVFVGPHVCFTNDLIPRAITPDGRLKGADDWEITPARQHGYVCRCARRLSNIHEHEGKLVGWCEVCNQECQVG